MSTDAERELMQAALRQLDGKISYQKLAEDLGMNSAGSAAKRWTRFKAKLASGDTKQPATPPAAKSSTKTATPASKSGVKAKKSGSNKRKRNQSDDDEGEEILKGNGGTDGEAAERKVLSGTSSRKLPAEKERVMNSKAEGSGSEDENGGVSFEDSRRGFAQGGTVKTEKLGGDSKEEA